VLIALNPTWYLQAAIFLGFGVGFYMLHSCIQLHVTDLTQTARGAALSLHSSSFYFGQAIGPVYYNFAFGRFGISDPLLLSAAIILVIGLVCARFLRHRRQGPGLAEGA
jgi:MFS transporter, DHA1 family, inner membrane transport protein